VVAPAADGYLGILSGHAPLVAALTVGELTITPPEAEPIEIALSGGFLRVDGDNVLILADTAELAKEIDIERAQRAVERAETRLREGPAETDIEHARMAMLRALNRLRVARRGL